MERSHDHGKTRRPNAESGARASLAALQPSNLTDINHQTDLPYYRGKTTAFSTSQHDQRVANVDYLMLSRRLLDTRNTRPWMSSLLERIRCD